MASKTHYFTDEFPNKDYKPTVGSTQAQTKLWPAYLPVDNDRLLIFERSKNAQLVVYTARFKDRDQRVLDPRSPLDINWQSYGWTDHPTSNGTGMVERKLAWGYSHKPFDRASLPGAAYGSCYEITLNALPSHKAQLYFDEKGRLVLQTLINGTPARLWKIFVCTNDSTAFVPRVLYVELYGMSLNNGQDICERITVS